jgi:outer membrane protein OmpA-like peptidoglycan-associated protein
MKNKFLVVFAALMFCYCSQDRKLLRKASNAVDRLEYDKAVSYYDQMISRDSGSFYGNAGKGIVLSEYLARHEQAIPYLERSLRNSPKKSKPVIHGDLGRSYHYIGNYKRALEHYAVIEKTNDEAYSDYDEFLRKRIADCRFALAHPDVATSENQYVKNAGSAVNTIDPEFAPVYVNGTLYFTSKRQEDPKEKRNGVDGKFYESVYVAPVMGDSAVGAAKHQKMPFSVMKNYGEGVASASADGKTMFLYKGGKIFQVQPSNMQQEPVSVDKINGAGMLNYAALSPDNKTLFFSRESDRKNGAGGSDIYMAMRNDDGSWSEPKILPYPVNTQYDEDAPFMNESGLLFFSSNGHPGYGGYDIYKTKLVNGEWMTPENLGQPINSPGDDINFALKAKSPNGYFASARAGGYGDLDIYHVHYLMTETPVCNPSDSMLTINTEGTGDPLKYRVAAKLPENFKGRVKSYRWTVNGESVAQSGNSFEHTFKNAGEQRISARLVAYCDTCPTLVGMCAEKKITTGTPILASADQPNKTGEDASTLGVGKKKGLNDKKGKKNESGGADETATASGNTSDNSRDSKNKGKTQQNTGIPDPALASSNKSKNDQASAVTNGSSADVIATNDKGAASKRALEPVALTEEQLKAIGWEAVPEYFSYNESAVTESSKNILNQHINILKSKAHLSITITGHADSRGNSSYNQALSLKRAQAVRDYFVTNGIAPGRIKSVKGAGETQLVNNCSDAVECSDEQHQQNRRVVVTVITSKGNSETLTSN